MLQENRRISSIINKNLTDTVQVRAIAFTDCMHPITPAKIHMKFWHLVLPVAMMLTLEIPEQAEKSMRNRCMMDWVWNVDSSTSGKYFSS
jgi:hypothetical protein